MSATTKAESAETIEKSRNIVERMAAVMSEVTAVGKTGQNREQGYAFRSIDEFMNSLHGPLSKHGVVITPKILERQISERERRNGGITRIVDLLVEYTFHSPDGSYVTTITAGEGADVADKATNKAMAGALKYAIMQTFVVPTRDMIDGDSETPEVPSQRESAAVHAERVEAAALPPREEIMRKLDEACDALAQTRAKITEKWRKTNNVGPVAELEDESKTPSLALYRFVVSLQPYVDQALKQRTEAAAQETETTPQDPDVPEPTDDERAAAARAAIATKVCDARDGDRTCTRSAGHDGEHAWW